MSTTAAPAGPAAAPPATNPPHSLTLSLSRSLALALSRCLAVSLSRCLSLSLGEFGPQRVCPNRTPLHSLARSIAHAHTVSVSVSHFALTLTHA
eukprot:3343984-Rhodomonas_salina.1